MKYEDKIFDNKRFILSFQNYARTRFTPKIRDFTIKPNYISEQNTIDTNSKKVFNGKLKRYVRYI